jgi:hypothetical protein
VSDQAYNILKSYRVTVTLAEGEERAFRSLGGFYVTPEGILSVFSPIDPDETRFVAAPGCWRSVECRPLEEDAHEID